MKSKCFSKRTSEVFRCGVRGDDVIAPATRSPTARNTLALSLAMEACPHWLHSRLRFTSTAVFHAADIWAARVKQKGCFVPTAGEILPQQLPFTFQRPRCGAEQVRFFKGGQWSVKAGSANHSFHQVSVPYWMSKLAVPSMRCTWQRRVLELSPERIDSTHFVLANGWVMGGAFGFRAEFSGRRNITVTPDVTVIVGKNMLEA